MEQTIEQMIAADPFYRPGAGRHRGVSSPHSTACIPVHPAYDEAVLQASRKWKYRPAMKDGLPVNYRKLILISLAPQDESTAFEVSDARSKAVLDAELQNARRARD
jgi:hypothetical protein